MSVDITGKYQMHSSQNFDEFLKAVGLSLLKRKLASAMEVATVDITRSGSTYTIRTTTPLKTHEVTFVLGMTMHETTIDGREVQV
ncbi:FABP7 [Ramazzottius varieornatus]|uniref:FABP7 n=1 Tax=Ramazzottius varieornatus TaxID=947166 RepID=A0A1D1VMP6_RAMVA|nr:FABP7 [Ramazzottius varieornatus]